MKQIRRNKQKKWRNTYGKPFLSRRAFYSVQVASNVTAHACKVSRITRTHGGCFALQAFAIANYILENAKTMKRLSRKMNEGFASR